MNGFIKHFLKLIVSLSLGVFSINYAYAKALEITSTAFKNNTSIPEKFSCDGNDVSPPLAWSNSPKGTQSFVLISKDPDASNGIWYHWVVFDIPATTTNLSENTIPAGAMVSKNSWGRAQYNGPCPPPGKPHRYIFTLYALDIPLSLPKEANAKIVEDAIRGHILQSATLTGLFSK
jgi:Raf kinase inhibitor-like YbhB/YbcL family protein